MVRAAVVRGAVSVPREPAVHAVSPRGLAHVLGAARDGLVHGPHGRRGDHVGEADGGIARVARPTRVVSLGGATVRAGHAGEAGGRRVHDTVASGATAEMVTLVVRASSPPRRRRCSARVVLTLRFRNSTKTFFGGRPRSFVLFSGDPQPYNARGVVDLPIEIEDVSPSYTWRFAGAETQARARAAPQRYEQP